MTHVTGCIMWLQVKYTFSYPGYKVFPVSFHTLLFGTAKDSLSEVVVNVDGAPEGNGTVREMEPVSPATSWWRATQKSHPTWNCEENGD